MHFVMQMHYNTCWGIYMPANALVQTRIDAQVKARAAAVLEEIGMTVSDAVRILLTRTANEGALPFPVDPGGAAHDEWFRAKVREALADPRPAIAHHRVKEHFAGRRAAASKKTVG
jgi:DNA-damage-inducible protein J